MPRLDGTGPEGKGSQAGRKLGECTESGEDDKLNRLGKGLGKGLGKKRKAGCGQGRGMRLKSGIQE